MYFLFILNTKITQYPQWGYTGLLPHCTETYSPGELQVLKQYLSLSHFKRITCLSLFLFTLVALVVAIFLFDMWNDLLLPLMVKRVQHPGDPCSILPFSDPGDKAQFSFRLCHRQPIFFFLLAVFDPWVQRKLESKIRFNNNNNNNYHHHLDKIHTF